MAMPTETERTTDRMRSVYFLKYCRRNSIIIPAKAVKTKETRTGLSRKRSPSVTPARDECARVSPIIEYRFSTRKSPMHGQRTAMQMEMMSAFCMKV